MANKILKYCTTCLILALVVSCQTNPSAFRIKGTIEGLVDGTVLELIPAATHKSEKGIASATTANGKFKFTGNIEEPQLFRIAVSGENTYGSIFAMIEPAASITMTANASKEETEGRIQYQFNDVNIKGSNVHAEYVKKSVEPREAMNKLYADYHAKNEEILTKVIEARKAKNETLLKTLYAADAWETLEKDEKNFFETVASIIERMVLDNADTWWGPFLMMNQLSYFGNEHKTWWDKFSDEAKNSYYGQLLNEELFPIGFVGQKAPAFTVSDGQEIKLETLLTGKKYTLIDFWASWCTPCLKEIPHLKEAYKIYAEKGFEIISISTDKSESDWTNALDKEQLPWPNFRDQSDIANSYKIKMIPSTFLVNEQGIIVEENLRGQDLLKKLVTLFP